MEHSMLLYANIVFNMSSARINIEKTFNGDFYAPPKTYLG